MHSPSRHSSADFSGLLLTVAELTAYFLFFLVLYVLITFFPFAFVGL